MKCLKYILLLILGISFLQSCVKEKETNYCLTGVPDNYDIIKDDTSYSGSSFNPNNKNEFLFVRQLKTNDYKSDLCIYDLTTKKARLIYSLPFQVSESPKWGKQDWIVLGYLGKVYHIKSDGTGFYQNPFIGYQYSLSWSKNGNYILGFVNTPTNAIHVIDMQGNVIAYSDTTVYYKGDWSESDIIASRDYGPVGNYGDQGLKFLQYPGFAFLKHLKVLEKPESITTMEWLPNNSSKVIWVSGHTIQQTDYITEVTEVIQQDNCKLQYNTVVRVNNDATKAVINRINYYSINEQYQTALTSRNLYLLDLNTRKEEKIEISY